MSEFGNDEASRSVHKRKKAASARYFEQPAEESEAAVKIKLKHKSKQNFDGDIIEVDQSTQKPLQQRWKSEQKVKKPKIAPELDKYSRGAKTEGAGVKTKGVVSEFGNDEVPTSAHKKKKATRYFEQPAEDSEAAVKIKLKQKSKQNFDGDIIEVDQSIQKPLQRPYKIEQKVRKPKIAPELLDKYSRGAKVEGSGVKTKHHKEKQRRKEIYLEYATEQAARTEILLHEAHGFIEAEEDDVTAVYKQEDIVKNVNIQAASKRFTLNLEFGPYCMRYTKNGRHLLIGGRRGHVAAFDWVSKKLHCEINVMEEVADVSWLHVPTMFACAQKEWVYIYDNQGTELHCIKRLFRVNCLEFLPYHFLLASANSDGYLGWLDVSIGEMVGNYKTNWGAIRMLRQNPYNGVLCTGNSRGIVSMWSPKVRKPLANIMCHSMPMSALTVDPKGLYMVTAGLDRKVKVWDVRALDGPLAVYNLRIPANQVEVSQRGVMALAQSNYCEVYTNVMMGGKVKKAKPYLNHNCNSFVHGMRFCAYEDVLGIATATGFQSLLVPGAGEPNFDALEDNPFQTRTQRREHEVHALLEKIPSELITLDPNEIAGVDVPTLQEKVEAKKALFHLKPPKIDFQTRRKMKGRGGSVKAARNKQIVKDLKRKEFITDVREAKKDIIKEHIADSEDFIPLEMKETPSVLDRFKPKIKK